MVDYYKYGGKYYNYACGIVQCGVRRHKMNVLPNFKLSYDGFISRLKSYGEQQFRTEKDFQVENSRLDLPLNRDFWGFALCMGRPPTADEFVKTVLRGRTNLINSLQINAIVARLHRAYCSFCRDMQVCLYLRESGKLDDVGYDITYDLENGIDCYFAFIGNNYAVAIYCDTFRSNLYKKKKDEKQTKLEDYTYIDLKFDPKNHRDVGNVWLFRKKHIDDFLEKIKGGNYV